MYNPNIETVQGLFLKVEGTLNYDLLVSQIGSGDKFSTERELESEILCSKEIYTGCEIFIDIELAGLQMTHLTIKQVKESQAEPLNRNTVYKFDLFES